MLWEKKTLINALKPKYYRTGVWQLDEAFYTLTRVRKCPPSAFFTPERSDCPVPLDRLNGHRTIYLDYGDGNIREVQDNFMTTGLPNQMMDGYWTGRTVFQLKTVPTVVGITPRHPLTTLLCTEAQSSTVRNPVRNSQGSPDLSTESKVDGFPDFDTEFHKALLELFDTHETETGELRTSHCWIHTPAGWIRFIMNQEDHCMSQTKLNFHMINSDRID